MKLLSLASSIIFLSISFVFSASAEIAIISKAKGNVSYKKSNSSEWKKVRSGLMLESGTMIRTADKSFALVKYIDDKSIVKMRPKSELTISGETESRNILKKVIINFGTAIFDVSKKQNKFQVITPTSVASIKGTKFIVMTAQNGGNTSIYGLEGLVNICPSAENKGDCSDLTANFKANCTKLGITIEAISDEDLRNIINSVTGNLKDSDESSIDIKTLELEFLSKDGRRKNVIIEYQ